MRSASVERDRKHLRAAGRRRRVGAVETGQREPSIAARDDVGLGDPGERRAAVRVRAGADAEQQREQRRASRSHLGIAAPPCQNTPPMVMMSTSAVTASAEIFRMLCARPERAFGLATYAGHVGRGGRAADQVAVAVERRPAGSGEVRGGGRVRRQVHVVACGREVVAQMRRDVEAVVAAVEREGRVTVVGESGDPARRGGPVDRHRPELVVVAVIRDDAHAADARGDSGWRHPRKDR